MEGEDEDEHERLALLWPDVKRFAFGPGEDPFLNAKVHLILPSRYRMALYIDGYQQAAEALFNKADESSGSLTNFYVFPIAFLWRHSIELALKWIISLGYAADGKSSELGELKAFKRHDLQELWSLAKPYAIKCGPPNHQGPEVENVEHNIHEFQALDPYATDFRYPTRNDKTTSLPDGPDLINLRNLHEAMAAVSAFLEGCTEVLHRRQEDQHE